MGILQARILEWGCCVLFHGIFPIQGSNPDLPPCRWILYSLRHQGSPWMVVIAFKVTHWYSPGTTWRPLQGCSHPPMLSTYFAWAPGEPCSLSFSPSLKSQVSPRWAEVCPWVWRKELVGEKLGSWGKQGSREVCLMWPEAEVEQVCWVGLGPGWALDVEGGRLPPGWPPGQPQGDRGLQNSLEEGHAWTSLSSSRVGLAVSCTSGPQTTCEEEPLDSIE